MKKFLFLQVFLVGFIQFGNSQDTKPEYLKAPENWEFERFSLPPGFAPSITYSGVEELRFAPGFSKKDSVNYFTYVFVARLDNTDGIRKEQLYQYLLAYYKGLAAATAGDKKPVVDTSTVTVKLSKNKLPQSEEIYIAEINSFGTFADNGPLKLNMVIEVMKDAANKRTFLYIIASPQPMIAPVWAQLYELRSHFAIPAK